jgi:uncharacterized protein YqjF (DUF2071 family)
MLNYQVDAALLREHVPRGTQLDGFGGRTLVSLVGFRFLRTRIFGAVPVPFHSNFDEVNLRFYVRRIDPSGEVRRGVVFIREIVPRRAIALVARIAYNENYSCYSMRHHVKRDGAGREQYRTVHQRALLGLFAATRRRHGGISGEASALARVAKRESRVRRRWRGDI